MDNYESPSEVLKKKKNGHIVENEKAVEPLNENIKSKLKFIDIFNENNDTDKNEEVNTFLKPKKVIKKRKDKKKGIPFFDDNYTNLDMEDLDIFSFGNSNLKINDNILSDNYKNKNDIYSDCLYDNYSNKISYLVSEIYRLKSELEESSQKECKKNEENKILLEKNNILSDSIDSMKKDIEKLKNIYDEETLRIKESYDRRLDVLKNELGEKDNYLKKKILEYENEANNKITDHENKYLNEKKKNDELTTSLENANKEKEDIIKHYTCEISNHKKEQENYKNEAEKYKNEMEKYKNEMESYKNEMEKIKCESDKWKDEAGKWKDEMNQRVQKINEINDEIKRIENILTEEKQTNEKLQTIIENSEKDITNLNNVINQKNETIKTMVNDILLVKNVYEELVQEKEENEISKQKLIKEIQEYEKKVVYLKNSIEEYNANNQKLIKCNQKLNENIRKKEKEIIALQNENIYLKRENVVFNQNFLNTKSCKSEQMKEYSSDSTNFCGKSEKYVNKHKDENFEMEEIKELENRSEIKEAGKKKKIDKKTKNKKKIYIKEKEDISTDTNGETESEDEKIEYNIEICDESEKEEMLSEQTKVGIIKDTGKNIELNKDETDKIQNIGGNNFIVSKNNSNKIGTEKLLSYKRPNMNIFDSKKNEDRHLINDKEKKKGSNIAIDQIDYNNDILHIEYPPPVILKKQINEKLEHSLMQNNKIQFFDITSNLVNIGNLSNELDRKNKPNFIKRDIHDKLGIFYDEFNDDIPYQESEEENENNNNREILMNNTKKQCLNLKTNSLLDNTLSDNFLNKQLSSSFLDKKINNSFINKEFGSNKYLYDLNLYKLKKCNIISYNNSIIPIKRTKKINLMRSIMDSSKTYIDNSVNKMNACENYLNKYNERNEMNNSSLKYIDSNNINSINQVHDEQNEMIIQPLSFQTIENVKGDNKTIDYFLSHIKNDKLNLNSNILLMKKGNKAITKFPNGQLHPSNKSNKEQKKEKKKIQNDNKISQYNNEDTYAISSFLNKMEDINDSPNDNISNNFVIKKKIKKLISDDKYTDVNNQRDIRSHLLSKYKKKSNIYGLFIINERLKNIYKNIENKKKSISNFPINMCNIEDMKKFSNSFNIIRNKSQEYFGNKKDVKNNENRNFNNKKDEYDEKHVVYPSIEENKLLLEISETQKEDIIGIQLSDEENVKNNGKSVGNNSDNKHDNICAVINYKDDQDTLREAVSQINKNKKNEYCDDYNESIETYACDSEHTQMFDYKEKEGRAIETNNFEETNNDSIYMNRSGNNRLKIIACSEKIDEKEKNIINNNDNEPSRKLNELFSKHVNISEHMRKLPMLYSSKIIKKNNRNTFSNGNNKKKKNIECDINRSDCFKNDFKLDESQDEYCGLLDIRNGYANITENSNENKIILRNEKKNKENDKKYKEYLNKIKADKIENKAEIFYDRKIMKHQEKDIFNVNETLNTSFNHFLLSYKLNRKGLENSNSEYNNNENNNTIFDIIKSEKMNKIKKKKKILALHNEISNKVIKNKPQNIQFDHYYNKLKILRDKNQRLKNDRDLSNEKRENYEKSNLSTQNMLLHTSQLSALHNKSERSGKTFNNICDKKTSENFLFNSNPLNNNSANIHRNHQNNFMVRKKSELKNF
ncbi:conserved Plasmodium protein, unknown function [Plasmodium berghei]|uniref:Uncharacterized protein n=2 Tax=Plasmodium berghei TaxID=5821 RepID=A0A509APG0_PLABA|nr:conserved Plasmodium protein, unknown function [Plasmodium berghei ANKA]CXJ02402.1 conserved Plasmodium protein, unknown function [Plasmodium berghei]SCL98300.1 conserved Plasmodium protein, unknown function [Plasmodium berghei]SCM16804.1 conserved Plasmodium protein, unknown function [Plasmodium berghei]SCM18602.1 conserved Plasmodium protein, unknown function [Plasmodium berghei]SCN28037.1 conserved Plasmodium protein, unknown function [Plasmodium berghei]|eukprot:XP_034423688.1 conserved Plasmodium protein, unknown function [Plasmodium berghei ANKA]